MSGGLRQAYHEAGHFVVARELGIVAEEAALYLHAPARRVIGHCYFGDGVLAATLDVERRVAIAYGGPIAQARHCRGSIVGILLGPGLGDLLRVGELAEQHGDAVGIAGFGLARQIVRTRWQSVVQVAGVLEYMFREHGNGGVRGWFLDQSARTPDWYCEQPSAGASS